MAVGSMRPAAGVSQSASGKDEKTLVLTLPKASHRAPLTPASARTCCDPQGRRGKSLFRFSQSDSDLYVLRALGGDTNKHSSKLHDLPHRLPIGETVEAAVDVLERETFAQEPIDR